MSDSYLSFVNSPWGRRLAQAIGLPQPLPLQRHRRGQQGLANPVIVAGAGRLAAQVQQIFSATDTVAATAATLKAPSTVKVQGAVFDATGVVDLQQLDELYVFFHANAKSPPPSMAAWWCSALLPKTCRDLPQAIAQRALEGLVRSLAKELRRAITVQLIYVAPGAEDAMDSSLRFFLSRRSAYVSGQVVRLEKPLDGPVTVNWDTPFAGRRALVTGASRGIGLAIAQVLARAAPMWCAWMCPKPRTRCNMPPPASVARRCHWTLPQQMRPRCCRPMSANPAPLTWWCITPGSPATALWSG